MMIEDLPSKRHSTCCTDEVSSQKAEHLQPRFGTGVSSALLSPSNMVQMGLSGCAAAQVLWSLPLSHFEVMDFSD